ncbi:uncharacterized protein [Nicotiana sylvestris]|uniref:uncharacterized protein n=1 Tax=Nicotiana sylvestris TaxID=4096 RepID=UPI00388CB22D
MLDGGSGVDICPLSTLQRMKIGTGRIRPNNVCVRAFDGIKRDTLGEIDLILTIGPVDFEVTFQVLDMDTSYNFLLGRPWIHAAGAVPSTLHQMVKFEDEDREIVVHGEDEQSIYRDPSIPCLEAGEGSEHTVYQVFEVVLAEQYEEGSPCPQPFLSNASIMVAKEMIRQGFKSAFNLLQKMKIGQRREKNEGWKLPRPLPHLYETFVRPKYIEEEDDEAFIAEEIEEICGAMREMLYETHMVQLGEGTSTAEFNRSRGSSRLISVIKSKKKIIKQLKTGVIQVLMDEEDAEKTAFTTPWGTYYYWVMPFDLKNAGATYMRAMTAIFHDMMHQEIELYVDDVIVKSKTQDDHVGSFEVHIPETNAYLEISKVANLAY